MRLILCFLLAPILSACATSFSLLDRELPILRGQNIEVAINYLGLPNQESTIAGRKVYLWSTRENNPFDQRAQPLACQIRMAVDSVGTILQVGYGGANGTCFVYADPLRPLLNK